MLDDNTAARWDPVRMRYTVEDREQELPLRLLVLGRFSIGAARLETLEPVAISADSLDAALRERCRELTLVVPDRLLTADGERCLQLQLRALRDFEPDRLVRHVPELRAVTELIDQLRAGQPPGDAALRPVLTDIGWQPGMEGDDLWRDYAVAELHSRLSQQLDALLHQPDFQSLEANWRGLALIADQLGEDRSCRLDILDLDKDSLREDFRSRPSADETLLFHTLYTREFGQYGGEPYTAVLAAYTFGPGNADVALLRNIAAVAAAAHAPFIAEASPELFGLRRFDELADAGSLPDTQRGPRYAKWRALLRMEASRYLALVLPRVLLRAPYDYRHGNVQSLAYRENISRHQTDCLWGSAAFGFAGCLIRSHRRFHVCVDVVGPTGGRLHGLPQAEQTPLYPAEVQLSERKEAELAELGLMPVAVARAHGYLGFNSAHSLHWGRRKARRTEGTDAHGLGLQLGAQLPYLFLISRIAHYLKVIQRDMIGTVTSPAEMETQLNTWLRRYVSDMENPTPAIRSQRPLREAQLTVSDDNGNYRMHLDVSPHTKHLGAEFALTLDTSSGTQ